MKVYLDYIFIENFLINFVLIKETEIISKRKTTNIRKILSALVASIYVIIMIILKIEQLNYLICKLLLSVIIIYVSFDTKDIKEYIKLLMLFFMVSMINVGTITVISNLSNIKVVNSFEKLSVYISGLIMGKIILSYMWKIYKREINNNDLIYNVKINIENKTYNYKAFLDTGNTVYSYTENLPILFAQIKENSMLENLRNKKGFEIKTVTLSNESKKIAYIFDNVEITQKNKRWNVEAGIVFENTKISRHNDYDMLLNYILFTEKLGGIKI